MKDCSNYYIILNRRGTNQRVVILSRSSLDYITNKKGRFTSETIAIANKGKHVRLMKH